MAKDRALDPEKQQPRAVVEVSESGGEATIYVYDVIGADWWGGVDAKEFAQAVDGVTAKTLNVRINSPGGVVFDGEAMAAAMERKRKSGCKVIACIDGLCASAATFLAMAADEVRASAGASFMVHNSLWVCIGNRHDMLDTAATMEKFDLSIAQKYSRKTGKDLAEMQALMDAETWFSAEEAKTAGLVDVIESAVDEPEPEPAKDEVGERIKAAQASIKLFVNALQDVTA